MRTVKEEENLGFRIRSVVPAMGQFGFKEQQVARLQLILLAVYLVLYLASNAVHTLMSGVHNTFAPGVRMRGEGDYEWINLLAL